MDKFYTRVFLNVSIGMEVYFMAVYLWTSSPFMFSRFMGYHLQYTALCLTWWASVYMGLDLAKVNSENSMIDTKIE